MPNQGVQSGINITNGASNTSVLGNVVSGNTQHAVTVFGATTNDNVIQGNFIGTDPTGLIRLANGGIGVDVVSASNTVVGGAGAARNIISGNGTGIQLRTGAAGHGGAEQLHRRSRLGHRGDFEQSRRHHHQRWGRGQHHRRCDGRAAQSHFRQHRRRHLAHWHI